MTVLQTATTARELRQTVTRVADSRSLTRRQVPAPWVPSKPRHPGDTLFQVETLRQARTFETYKNAYVSIGLCHYCAAQAAYGHQHGFSVVEQPCHVECWQVVQRLPIEEANTWRSVNVKSVSDVDQCRHAVWVEGVDPLTHLPSTEAVLAIPTTHEGHE